MRELEARCARLREGADAESRGQMVALRRSEERFRALVDATAQVIWTTDPAGRVVEDSPFWRAFTGQTRERSLRVSVADGERRLEVQGHAADVLRQSEPRFRHQALHDPLTGLANQALYRDRVAHALARAARDGTTAAVLFLDLDGFKRLNDTLGHAAGDRVLVTVAERLQVAVRADDTVARLGGDEFAVLAKARGGGRYAVAEPSADTAPRGRAD